ncbi:unnamed protein product [Penicillium olsonii]|uniref:Methyltransferase type 11 domain-containing protein n=1 Tax=Penicillium olsonii TaxID=99116 RepID=A0A9W4HG19_PENOL|nr:unnamed protein product [Penicillium olsonii]CAG8070275.1 unnamed protein product [Penicillium olsonii]
MNPEDVPNNLWLQVSQKHFRCFRASRVSARSVPSTRKKTVDDLNRRFTFPTNHFDFVHSRLLATGLNRSRWPSYLRDVVRVLKPGGWAQMVEIYFNVQSDNGSITDEHALRKWSTKYLSALEDKKDLRIGSKLRTLMADAGFVEVDTKMIPLPLSAWSTGWFFKDPWEITVTDSLISDLRMKGIGESNHENAQQLLQSLALYPLTQRLHMPPEVFTSLVAQAQREAADPTLKAYFPL